MNFKPLFLLVTFLVLSNHCISQEITMFQGFWKMKYYEDNTEISREQAVNLISTDVEANALWQKYKKQSAVGFIALGANIGFLFWYRDRNNDFKSTTAPLIGMIASGGVAIGFLLSSNTSRRKSILAYNHNQDVGSLHLGPTHNGLGLVWSF